MPLRRTRPSVPSIRPYRAHCRHKYATMPTPSWPQPKRRRRMIKPWPSKPLSVPYSMTNNALRPLKRVTGSNIFCLPVSGAIVTILPRPWWCYYAPKASQLGSPKDTPWARLMTQGRLLCVRRKRIVGSKSTSKATAGNDLNQRRRAIPRHRAMTRPQKSMRRHQLRRH